MIRIKLSEFAFLRLIKYDSWGCLWILSAYSQKACLQVCPILALSLF